jgi:hypothetical protein
MPVSYLQKSVGWHLTTVSSGEWLADPGCSLFVKGSNAIG